MAISGRVKENLEIMRELIRGKTHREVTEKFGRGPGNTRALFDRYLRLIQRTVLKGTYFSLPGPHRYMIVNMRAFPTLWLDVINQLEASYETWVPDDSKSNAPLPERMQRDLSVCIDLINGKSIKEVASRFSIKSPRVKYIFETFLSEVNSFLIRSGQMDKTADNLQEIRRNKPVWLRHLQRLDASYRLRLQ
jgi:hypothetical protein